MYYVTLFPNLFTTFFKIFFNSLSVSDYREVAEMFFLRETTKRRGD